MIIVELIQLNIVYELIQLKMDNRSKVYLKSYARVRILHIREYRMTKSFAHPRFFHKIPYLSEGIHALGS